MGNEPAKSRAPTAATGAKKHSKTASKPGSAVSRGKKRRSAKETTAPEGQCFVVIGAENKRLQIPVSLSTLHQMVIDGALSPGDRVATKTGETPRRLAEQSHLLPLAALRKKIVVLYRSRREEEALEEIERFREFEGLEGRPDHAYVLFVEALIREKFDSQRATDIYLEILSASGHDLERAVQNNLAVIKCRSEDFACALEHIKEAVEGPPPFLAALVNYRAILDRAVEVSKTRPVPEGAVDLEDAETVLAGLEKRIHDAAQAADRPGAGQGDRGIPGEDLATLIRPEELPRTLAYPGAPAPSLNFAYRCIHNARSALAAKSWDEVRFWVEEASNAAPDDRVVQTEVDRLGELAEKRDVIDTQGLRIENQESLLREIQELEREGRFTEAIHKTSVLMASANTTESMCAVMELNDRLRRKLGEQHLRDAERYREEDPDRAIDLFRSASRLHDSHQDEAEVQEGLLRWPILKREFINALRSRDFVAAAEFAHRLSELASTPEFEEEAKRMESELVREQARYELALAREACDAGNFAKARELVISAETRDPPIGSRARKLLEEIRAAEVRVFREEILADVAKAGPRAALARLQSAPSYFFTNPEIRRLLDVVTKTAREDMSDQVQEKFLKLKSAVGVDDFARAQELLDEVSELHPDSMEVMGLRRQIERTEKLFDARAAACRKQFKEAVEILVPLLTEDRDAFDLLINVTQEDLERLLPDAGRREKVLGHAVSGYRLITAGKRRTAVEKLEKLLESVPQFRIPAYVVESLVAITNEHLRVCKDAIDEGRWDEAEQSLQAVDREWGLEKPPRPIRNVVEAWRKIIHEEGDVDALLPWPQRVALFCRSVVKKIFPYRES